MNSLSFPFTKGFTITLFLFLSTIAYSQDFSPILNSIEEHSTHLNVVRLETEAEKLDSRDVYALSDPEIGFTYLFGMKGAANELDIDISQAFDFPTVIAQKRRLAKEMQRVSDMKYLSERQQLLLAARKLCIEVVFCNAMMDHLNEDMEETSKMKEMVEALYNKGEATIIERNKAHQSLLFFQAQYREFLTNKENLLNELQCMNGGIPVSIADTVFVHSPLSTDFDAWIKDNISRHPDIAVSEGNVSTEKQSLKVAKSERFPGLKIGYAGEFGNEEKRQGPSVGITLPLWGASRKIKSAKLHLEAAEKEAENTRLHLTTQLRNTYRDALQLQETIHQYRHHLKECNNSVLLQKSLDSGQMNILTYLNELQFVHEMHEKLLSAERDFKLREAELTF